MTEAAAAPRAPLATYRLQLGGDLGFDAAARLTEYLAALGISDCYTSPIFETSVPDSHGYDVADHNRLRSTLGGEEAFTRFVAALQGRGMGLLIDVVPNHMGIAGNRNAWWLDVLEYGPASPYARFFDIDWTPVKRELANKVLLPILGDQYGIVLERGELKLDVCDGAFCVRYHETLLPIAPRTYGRILSHRIDALQATLGADHPALLELKALTAWFVTLPSPGVDDPSAAARRREHKAEGVRRLAALLETAPEIRHFVDDNVRLFNGTVGEPHSFDLLDALLGDQAYRIAYWRVAGEEINYRRFFDINTLAAIRMEDSDVFAETHRLTFRLVAEGRVTGLRIDHPDGLYAPAEYLRRLRVAAARPVYVVVEKILAPGERLPEAWASEGTTGYEFLNLVNGIFVDRQHARWLDALYRRVRGERAVFTEIVYDSKRLIMETSMASEVAVLAHRLNVISEKHRSTRDFTLGRITRALRETIACFPVYRTYVGDGQDGPSPQDEEIIERAVTLAKQRDRAVDVSIYDWIHELLTLQVPAWATDDDRRERRDWVMRFQQLTGPITAKGYEDTALYRYHRLISLNDVGGDPARFGTSLAEFHAAMAERRERHPDGLSATATHDTKRGEDVRARINVLSEIPLEWRRRVARWQRLNRRHRTVVDGQPTPEPEIEYLLYQTLVGAWPLGGERLREYLTKALREAKLRSSWVSPNPRYEDAVFGFAEAIVDPKRAREFLRDFTAFQARVAHFGALNSLAQTLVKITAPGVPDFYQGTELWDLSLVDPDNRRPVDFDLRRRLLDALVAAIEGARDLAELGRELWKSKEDGRLKLYVIRQALACRRAHARLFQRGEYRPLEVDGPLAEHVIAFARVREADVTVTVVPRLLARRAVDDAPFGTAYWGTDTSVRMPVEGGASFVNVFTGDRLALEGTLPLARAFASFPVALLVRDMGAAARDSRGPAGAAAGEQTVG